jgi:putative membrane protein insertion efficiency factor
MSPVGLVLRGLIRGYQLVISPVMPLLSPVSPAGCRFTPSCSNYAMEAISTHGAAVGSWLAARRLCRCHPWNDGGYDPVPDLPIPDPKIAERGGKAAPSRHPDRMS